MIQIVAGRVPSGRLWAAEGRTAATFNLAAGMSTGGLVTNWLAAMLGRDHQELAAAAERVRAGSDGLLLLPYFAGERTPILDPGARGTWIGLTLDHTPGHLYRSALEGIALGVRHNLDAMTEAHANAQRLVAVGGGTAQRVWTQIVSDVTGLPQDLPTVTVGAAYGDARIAADALGIDTTTWNPITQRLSPSPDVAELYASLYEMYRSTYAALAPTMHRLAKIGV
jgi:xylulokinase